MVSDIKSKLSKKKANDHLEEDEDESIDEQDGTDPALNADKTGATDIGQLHDDEDDKPQTLVDKIRSKLVPKKKSSSDDDEDGTEVNKKVPKKKINPVVLVIVVAALGFFLFYETDEGTEVETIDPAATLKKPAYTKRAKPVPPVENPETPVATEPATDTPAVTDAPAETPAEAPVEPTVTEPTVEAPVETPVDPTVETTPTIEEPVVTDLPTPEPEAPVEDKPMITDEDSVDGQVTKPSDENLTDKILEDLEKQVKKEQPKEIKKEYVSPPDYEYKGRGLVYNCTGKHWACVDAPSYKTCEDNYSSSTYKKKNIECYPFNVYESTRGCELMQNRVVSSSAKTDFCKGN